MQSELLLDARAELGEGPAWDARKGRLYWLDIHAGRLHTYDPSRNTDQFTSLPEPVGCLAPTRAGDLVLAMPSGIWRLSLSAGLTRLAVPENIPGNRFNDGKCDPAGRFLAGTMDDAEQEASGSLYSFSPDGGLKTLLTGLRISNGLTWSPDQKTFYFIDTPTRLVKAYDYHLDTGEITSPRAVLRVAEELGWPDGMTSDMDGFLWIAMWAGAKMTRWNPRTGEMTLAHPLPALNVTACAFGGADLSDLYITTARKGMSASQLAEYPLSGGLFRLQTSQRGLQTFEFADGLG